MSCSKIYSQIFLQSLHYYKKVNQKVKQICKNIKNILKSFDNQISDKA